MYLKCIYNLKVHATFARSSQDVKLVQRRDITPLQNIVVDPNTRELIYSDFSPSSQEVCLLSFA